MNRIDDYSLQEEINGNYKPSAIHTGLNRLPFNDLSDRNFEILIYQYLKEKIKTKNETRFTDISLMQGVGERGRDCCLYMDGEIIGIVQCKKYNERITRPAILKEILKFIMHSIIDDDIYPYKLNNFYYIVFVSNDYTEPAMTLLKQFKGEIKKEDVEKYFNEIKNTYDSLKFLEYNLYKDKIESKLNNLSIENYNSHDLTLELQCYPQLIPAYFSVMNVISVEQNKEIIMECLEKFGLKYVTDLNLKNFEERIKNIPDENRINLGVVDFYGYNIDFIIKNKDLVMSIYKNLTMEKNKLDREILAYITNLINEKILQYISILVMRKRFNF
ncbi:MAG: hypothetical protein IPO06_10245 [Leptospiraceae bacterium]|nr:hypothetical protein [Leptospiraceae bacterium]